MPPAMFRFSLCWEIHHRATVAAARRYPSTKPLLTTLTRFWYPKPPLGMYPLRRIRAIRTYRICQWWVTYYVDIHYYHLCCLENLICVSLYPSESSLLYSIACFWLCATLFYILQLAQSKISIKQNSSIHVDVQVRSNLNNTGDLADFTLAVPVPSYIDGKSIVVSKGEGTYDELKRVVKWKREKLPRGESFLVGFQAQLVGGTPTSSVQNSRLPILLRCTSIKDKISTMEVDATAVVGHSATVHTVRSTSFRLLHRVTS